jgi:hypothetical protein
VAGWTHTARRASRAQEYGRSEVIATCVIAIAGCFVYAEQINAVAGSGSSPLRRSAF